MPITLSDVHFYLSGGGSNTDPSASLGGVISSTVAGSNLFDGLSDAQIAAGRVDYRCVYLKNGHATLEWLDVVVWIRKNTPRSDTSFEVGLGTSDVGDTEQTIANATTAPSGVTFDDAPDFANGLEVGVLYPGETVAIWLKRTVDAGAEKSTDFMVLRSSGKTRA